MGPPGLLSLLFFAIFTGHFCRKKVGTGHFYLGFCKKYEQIVNKNERKIEKWPKKVGKLPFLESKSGHKMTQHIVFFRQKTQHIVATGQKPTFIPYLNAKKKH